MNREEIEKHRQFLRDVINAGVILGNDLLDSFSTISKALIADVSIVDHIDTLGEWALDFVVLYPYNPELDSTEQLYTKFDECWDVAVSNYGLQKVREHFAQHGMLWDRELSDWCAAGKPWDWDEKRGAKPFHLTDVEKEGITPQLAEALRYGVPEDEDEDDDDDDQ